MSNTQKAELAILKLYTHELERIAKALDSGRSLGQALFGRYPNEQVRLVLDYVNDYASESQGKLGKNAYEWDKSLPE